MLPAASLPLKGDAHLPVSPRAVRNAQRSWSEPLGPELLEFQPGGPTFRQHSADLRRARKGAALRPGGHWSGFCPSGCGFSAGARSPLASLQPLASATSWRKPNGINPLVPRSLTIEQPDERQDDIGIGLTQGGRIRCGRGVAGRSRWQGNCGFEERSIFLIVDGREPGYEGCQRQDAWRNCHTFCFKLDFPEWRSVLQWEPGAKDRARSGVVYGFLNNSFSSIFLEHAGADSTDELSPQGTISRARSCRK